MSVIRLRSPFMSLSSEFFIAAKRGQPTRASQVSLQRDMAQALADGPTEPQIVVLCDQTVPAPVLALPMGRAHHDRVQVKGRIKGRANHHGRHVATSGMK